MLRKKPTYVDNKPLISEEWNEIVNNHIPITNMDFYAQYSSLWTPQWWYTKIDQAMAWRAFRAL